MRSFSLLILGLCVGAISLHAEEPAKAPAASVSPLQVLKECLTAVRSGDFVRYVDTLAPEEQDVQAGYAVYAASMLAFADAVGGQPSVDPESMLTLRVLEDVKAKHFVPEQDRTEEQQKIAGLPSEMANKLLLDGLVAAGLNYTPPAQTPAELLFPQQSARKKFRDYSKIVENRPSFLTDLLTQINQPLEVTSQGESEVKGSGFVESLAGLEKIEWILYRRGDSAIATPARSATIPAWLQNLCAMTRSITTSDEAGEEIPQNESEQQQAVKPEPDDDHNWLRIEFLRIDNQWKIRSLLPEQLLAASIASLSPRVATPSERPLSQSLPGQSNQPHRVVPASVYEPGTSAR